MIDLHCHLLPGIDDGAPDVETALAMARIAVDDGIAFTACTPHIYPGLYENTTRQIRERVGALQATLDAEGIALRLTSGSDAHLTLELLDRLKTGTVPTLNGGRYFLLEPPHHVAPPRFEEAVFNFLVTGYVPVITHPERLTWINTHYEVFRKIALSGGWLQVTAGSLNGRFGNGAKYWANGCSATGWCTSWRPTRTTCAGGRPCWPRAGKQRKSTSARRKRTGWCSSARGRSSTTSPRPRSHGSRRCWRKTSARKSPDSGGA